MAPRHSIDSVETRLLSDLTCPHCFPESLGTQNESATFGSPAQNLLIHSSRAGAAEAHDCENNYEDGHDQGDPKQAT
jgi:hypothetical protein